jgi:hypothetical protein
MRCPRVNASRELCAKPITDPGLWIAAGLDYCSPQRAAAADNAIHTSTVVAPSRPEWQTEAEARAAARRWAEREAERARYDEGSGI